MNNEKLNIIAEEEEITQNDKKDDLTLETTKSKKSVNQSDNLFVCNVDIRNLHEQCHMKNVCSRHETCPMILVHKLISGKWKMLILWYLTPGPLRFSDLKRKLPKVTQKMLTNQLRSLEEDGLIFRKVYPVVPPKVEYGLTKVGMKMYPILKQMYSFGIMYLKESDGDVISKIDIE